MRGRRSIVVSVMALAACVPVPTQPALAAYDCANRVHNGVGADGASTTTNTNINGIAGTVYVPQYTSANLYGQYTTAGNLAMLIEDSAGHFFQIGWYVGSATGLPYTSTPRYFAGEGTYHGETLYQTSRSVSGGTWHAFRLVQDENPLSASFRHYRGYVDGVLVWTSAMSTTIEGTPRFLGETNFDCADMYAHASTSSGGPTLQGHHAMSTWSTWQQRLEARFGEPARTRECWASDRINGHTATVLAHDLCQ